MSFRLRKRTFILLFIFFFVLCFFLLYLTGIVLNPIPKDKILLNSSYVEQELFESYGRIWLHHHDDEGEAVFVLDNIIYTASKPCNSGYTIKATCLQEGRIIWQKKLHHSYFRGSIALITNGFSRNLFVVDGVLFSAGTLGDVVALDIDNGRIIWKHNHHKDSVWEVHYYNLSLTLKSV